MAGASAASYPDALFEALRPERDSAWPESWRVSWDHDDVEIWGSRVNRPYTLAYHQRRARVLAALRAVTPAGGKVLDLAAAQGNYALAASALGYDVTWNDLRAELIDYVRLKAPGEAKRLHFVPGNILELGARFHGAFDTVLALEVIEHVAHPDRFLAALSRLIREDGHIVLTTPNGGYFRNDLPRFSDHPDPSAFESEQFKPDSDGHIFLLHEDEMRSLAAKAGLAVVRHDFFTNPLSFGHVKTHYLHRLLPVPAIAGIEAATSRMPRALQRRLAFASITVLERG